MVEDLDINISCNISKYFWEKMSEGNIDISNGEMGVTIVFFEALPDDFYNLIESSGANRGKVKSILDERSSGGVTGCRLLKVNNETVSKDVYAYPIFNNEGENGFYVVVYDRDEDVTITNPLTDIVAICKNLIIDLDDDEEHTIKGFLIQTNDDNDASKDDYLLAYSRLTNPITVSKHLMFTRNTKIINVGLCENNDIGGL